MPLFGWYIENDACVEFYHEVTRRESEQLNHRILELSRQSCDVIGHCLFLWRHDKIRHIGIIFDIGPLPLYSIILSETFEKFDFQTHISNDGATILQLLDIVHPAAKTLVDIAKSQDAEIGDGTTSVTLLACEFMTVNTKES